MKKVYNAYCKAEEFLFSFLFAVMVALVFSSAIARGIGKPLAWSLDVAQLLLCWTSLVGADVAFRHEAADRRFPHNGFGKPPARTA